MNKLSEILGGLHSLAAEASRSILEPILYTAGIGAYATGVRLASLRNRKAALMVKGHRQTLTRLCEKIDPAYDRTVWIHAASLGEFEQGRPLMERLRREHPELKIVLSFFSPSGYEVRKDFAGADAVVYLPFDTPGNVRRFIDAINPEMAIFVKYEFWRNYLHELSRRAIPTYLISAIFRPDQAFFKRRSAWYRHWLRLYSHIYVQDERSRSLLQGAGITDVTVAGDTRFDRVTDIMRMKKEIPELEAFTTGDAPVFIAGSSWPADEQVYMPWLNRHSEVKVIIAPHEFDAARLETMRKALPGSVLLTEVREGKADLSAARAVIIDCFGLLSSAYAYGDVAYVGGAFGAGLHNINEAAVYGIPVIYGPNNKKFIEAQELAAAGGGYPIASKDDFEAVADRLFSDDDARREGGERAAAYIRSKLGATDIIYASLF